MYQTATPPRSFHRQPLLCYRADRTAVSPVACADAYSLYQRSRGEKEFIINVRLSSRLDQHFLTVS